MVGVTENEPAGVQQAVLIHHTLVVRPITGGAEQRSTCYQKKEDVQCNDVFKLYSTVFEN